MPNLTEDENNDFENSMARDALEKVKTFQNSHDLKVNFFSLLRALEVGCQGEYSWIPALQGVPKKTHFHNSVGATVHWLNHK